MINVHIYEHQQIIHLFNKYKVRYMLVGGYAVNYYGFTRNTGDMDFWVDPTNENKELIISALLEFGIDKYDIAELGEEDFTKHMVFSLGLAPEKIDFMTRVNLVVFEEAYERREEYEFDNVMIPVVHRKDLILSKINTDRLKDKIDIETLQKIYGTDS